jgi:hypothetical protein
MIDFIGAARDVLFLEGIERAMQVPQELIVKQNDQVDWVIVGEGRFAIGLKRVHGYFRLPS